MTTVNHRHIYDKAHLETYFKRIALPEKQRVYDASILPDEEKLAYLNLLQKHQLTHVPWENVTQHYSWHRTICVKPRILFQKIVEQRGRGGYCMEANYFFHLILTSLKFDCYISGSRIYFPVEKIYGGWTHTVNIVVVGDTKYLLDGGMGPNGPDHPVPIEEGVVSPQIAPAEVRLTKENLPQNLDKSQKIWVFSYRYNQDREWSPVYCFTDLEFFPSDIESMNFEPWLNPQTFFTHKVVAVRFSTDRETDDGDGPGSPDEAATAGEINGTMTLNHDIFKWRVHGKKMVEIKFKTEKDRVDCLKRYFGIELSLDDQESILGSAADIDAAVFAKG